MAPNPGERPSAREVLASDLLPPRLEDEQVGSRHHRVAVSVSVKGSTGHVHKAAPEPFLDVAPRGPSCASRPACLRVRQVQVTPPSHSCY